MSGIESNLDTPHTFAADYETESVALYDPYGEEHEQFTRRYVPYSFKTLSAILQQTAHDRFDYRWHRASSLWLNYGISPHTGEPGSSKRYVDSKSADDDAIYSEAAVRDIRTIFFRIEKYVSVKYALVGVSTILAAARRLKASNMGVARDDIMFGLRTARALWPFEMLYRRLDDDLQVLRILEESRIPKLPVPVVVPEPYTCEFDDEHEDAAVRFCRTHGGFVDETMAYGTLNTIKSLETRCTKA